MKENIFTYDSRSLRVLATLKGDRWVVRVYQDDKPANGVEYSVTLENAFDAGPVDLVAGLMDTAKRDFMSWSDWQKDEAAKQSGTSN